MRISKFYSGNISNNCFDDTKSQLVLVNDCVGGELELKKER